MLRKIIFIVVLIISVWIVADSIINEVTIQKTYQIEKIKLEKEADPILKLQIPEWNFERIIKEGTVSNIDKTFATLLIGNKNNIIIAGHDIPIVFHVLHDITLGMIVYLKKGNQIIEYVVTQKLVVKPTEVRYLEETEKEQLTLITCTDYNQKRLIILCDKKSIS